MKKLIALLLAVLMVMTLLGACSTNVPTQTGADNSAETAQGQAPGDSAAQAEPSAPTEPSEPAQEAPVANEDVPPPEAAVSGVTYPLDNPTGKTVKIWFEVPPMIGPYCEDMSQVAAFRAAKEATGVSLDVTAVSTAASEAFNLMINSGSYKDFDIVGGGAQMYGSASASYTEGIFIALNDYVDEYMPDFAVFIEEYDFAKYLSTDDGKLLDIAGLGTGGMAQGTAVRKDWLDDLGLEIPVTYDDYFEVLKAFKSAYDCQEPFLLNSTGFVDNNFLCGGYGVSSSGMFGSSNDWFVVENGKVQYSLLADGFKEYVTMMNQWYEEGLFSENFLSNVQGAGFSYDSQMLGGDAGIFVTGYDALGSSYASRAEDPNFNVVAIADAVKKQGDTIKVGFTPNSDPVSNRWNITTGCDDLELVLNYCNWFFTEEGGVACNWGIENEGFEYVNGEPNYTQLVTDNPDGMMLFVATAIYTNWSTPYIVDERTTTASFDSQAQFDAKAIWNSNRSDENKCRGDLEPEESEEFNAAFSDIRTYASEMTLNFIVGTTSVEDGWDDYVATIKSMDINTCLALRQAAHDRYTQR